MKRDSRKSKERQLSRKKGIGGKAENVGWDLLWEKKKNNGQKKKKTEPLQKPGGGGQQKKEKESNLRMRKIKSPTAQKGGDVRYSARRRKEVGVRGRPKKGNLSKGEWG